MEGNEQSCNDSSIERKLVAKLFDNRLIVEIFFFQNSFHIFFAILSTKQLKIIIKK